MSNAFDWKYLSELVPFKNSDNQPVMFIGHGSPMNAISDNNFTKALHQIGKEIKVKYQPQAILVVSAHWLTKGTLVLAKPNPSLIYDFGGFPKPLYEVKYPAKGSPETAFEIAKNIKEIEIDETWGLDHGSWTILKHLFPEADIPVLELSLDYYLPLQEHLNLAEKLKFLRKKGVLIIGSGNVVHNLQMSIQNFMKNDASAYDWAYEFDHWIGSTLAKNDYSALINYKNMGKAALLSVPTPDHYLPLLYSAGLLDKNETLKSFYEEVSFGGISMRSMISENI